MIENIGGVTSQLIGASLDALFMKHQVIANNIANANTFGYTSKTMSFEQQLLTIMNAYSTDNDLSSVKQNIASFREQLSTNEFVSSSSQSVELDQEVVALTENTLRYQALLTASSKRGDIIKMAIREGR